jgi:hypothetical protein
MLATQNIRNYADQQHSQRISNGEITMPMTTQDDNYERLIDYAKDNFIMLTEEATRRILTGIEMMLLESTTHLMAHCINENTRRAKTHYLNLLQESQQ